MYEFLENLFRPYGTRVNFSTATQHFRAGLITVPLRATAFSALWVYALTRKSKPVSS